MKELKNWFSKRGYLGKIISEQVIRALRSEENFKENGGQDMKGNSVPLVETYNPNFKNLSFLIRKNLQFLHADQKSKRVLYASTFSHQSARNLKSFLVRSKVYPLEREVGSVNCQLCSNINETDTFEPFQIKLKYMINHHLNCNEKCLIYLLSCIVCGLQCLGSTTEKFRFRWSSYKENDRKALKNICSQNLYTFCR